MYKSSKFSHFMKQETDVKRISLFLPCPVSRPKDQILESPHTNPKPEPFTNVTHYSKTAVSKQVHSIYVFP